MVTVQRAEINREQTSTLFWLNVGVGLVLTGIGVALAPAIAAFYNESRLFWICVVSAIGFLFSGLATQHLALLQRNLRFSTLVTIDIVSFLGGSGLSISLAAAGYGYWALVGMGLGTSIISAALAWLTVPWIPGRPVMRKDVFSMLQFGGLVTTNNIIMYIAYNIEKVLLGRYWGAPLLGTYNRAYQLINLPSTQVHSALFSVAFSTFSRIQTDPTRVRSAFLKGYSAIQAITIAATVFFMIFADDLIRIALGSKWTEATPVLRLLGPSVIALSIINPPGWLLASTGRVGRALGISCLISPVVLIAVALGLSYGPIGVAISYSTAFTVLVVPVLAWAFHNTGIGLRDVAKALWAPTVSALIAMIACWSLDGEWFGAQPSGVRLILGGITFSVVYIGSLLLHSEQRRMYVDFQRQLFARES